MNPHSQRNLPINLRNLNYVLSALNILGQCPLTSSEGPNKAFKSSWFTRGTLVCLPGAVLGLFAWFIMLTHLGLAKCFILGPGIRQGITEIENQLLNNPTIDENMKTANIGIHRIIILCMALENMLHILWGWASDKKLATLMKNWANLSKLTRSLVLSHKRDIKEGVLYYLSIAAGVVYMCTVTLVCSIYVIWSCTEVVCEKVTAQVLFSVYQVTATLQDAKAALILNQLANDFKQVRMEKDWILNSEKVFRDDVRAWRKAVILTRRQTCAAAEYLAIPELAMLFQILLVGLGTIFMAMYNAWGNEGYPIQESCIFVAVSLLLRLLVKTVLAERITKSESEIVQDLMDLQVKDDLVREEVKDLQDILLQSPTEINLANIVVLRKKLCLGVISQILTYLIVLIQFYDK